MEQTGAGRRGISFEQVAAVADAIRAEGGSVTQLEVRRRLGETGSMGTIQRHLSRWREENRQAPAQSLSLPGEVQRVLVEMQRALLAEIERERADARAGLEAELATCKQELEALARDSERQNAEIEAAQAAIIKLQAQVQQRDGRISQLEADLSAAAGREAREREAAELARQELAKAQLRLESLPSLNETLRAAQDSAKRAQERAAEAERRVAALEAGKQALEAREKVLEADKAALAVKLEEAERFASQLRELVTQAKAETAAAREQAAEYRGRLAALEGKATGGIAAAAEPATKQKSVVERRGKAKQGDRG